MNYPSKSPLPHIEDFRSIVVENRPLIDTRAPVEFAKGAFPNAVNLPLMNDEERERVGTVYKKKGHDAAVALGHELVGGKIRKVRIRAWLDFLEKHPDAYIYCWRGGQRSQIVQQWIHEISGKAVPRLKGGYKAFRHYLMEESLRLAREKKVLILGGRTGSGKTLLIEKIPEAIDLEGIAHHRGSAFGRYAHSQPSQIDFENALAYAQIRHDAAQHPFLLIEDESRNIGQRYIPTEVFQAFQRGKVLLLETPLEERIEISYQDYILFAQREYDEAYARGETPYDWYETMRHNFRRIRKRLGNERYERFTALLDSAWKEQQRSGTTEQHKEWIRALLEEYYDPMYDYQIEKKKDRIVFQGNANEILEFLGQFRS